MKKLFGSKISILIAAAAGLLALVLLTVALRSITFRTPDPFSFSFNGFSIATGSSSGIKIPIWRYFMFGGLLILILAVIMFFLDPELRKRILYRLFRMALAMLMIYLFANYIYDRRALQQMLSPLSAAGAPISTDTAQNSLPVYNPPQINPWLVTVVSFAIGLALVLLGWVIYRRRLRPPALLGMEEVAKIARDALDDLESDRNWDDAIVRAYVRMNQAVVAERGLLRQPGITPREHAGRIERLGLPGEAVRTLTGLFEAVRYGGASSSPADRDLAASALNAILSYCERNT